MMLREVPAVDLASLARGMVGRLQRRSEANFLPTPTVEPAKVQSAEIGVVMISNWSCVASNASGRHSPYRGFLSLEGHCPTPMFWRRLFWQLYILRVLKPAF